MYFRYILCLVNMCVLSKQVIYIFLPVLFNINSSVFNIFLTVADNQLKYIMESKQLCIIYYNCPHCYSSSVESDSSCDSSTSYYDILCHNRRCCHCYCTSGEEMMSSCDSSSDSSSDSSCDSSSDMEDLIEVTVVDLAKNIKDVGGVVLMDEEIGDEAGVGVEAGVEVEPEVENVVQQGGYDADMEDN